MPTDLLPLFQGGGLAVAGFVFLVLHRSAVRAHRQRADDWRMAAQIATKRADERDQQLWEVLGVVHSKVGRRDEAKET